MEWSEIAKEMCHPGIKAKFVQNTPLLLLLQSTEDQTLVEASHDNVWGTGIPLNDTNCLNRKHWKNIGILGEILMDIRKESLHSPSNITSQNSEDPNIIQDMTNPNLKVSRLNQDMTGPKRMMNPNQKDMTSPNVTLFSTLVCFLIFLIFFIFCLLSIAFH